MAVRIKKIRCSPLAFKAEIDNFKKDKGDALRLITIQSKPVIYDYVIKYEITRIEQWRDVPGYGNNYKASDMGRLLSVRYNRVMTPYMREDFNHLVTRFNGKSVCVHRVIAEVWVSNPNGLPHVGFVNGNHSDTRPENLYWKKRGKCV